MKSILNLVSTKPNYDSIKFQSIGYGLILLMTFVAWRINQKEVILPEMAALCIGCFLYRKESWIKKPINLFILPSSTAFMGFFINYLEINIAVKIVVVLVSIFLFLHLLKSSLAPAIATGLLPIVTDCESYLFLISIIFFMGLLALCTSVFLIKEKRQISSVDEPKKGISIMLYLLVIFVWLGICYLEGNSSIAVIPPIVVMGFENLDRKQYTFKMLYKQLLALVLVAISGAYSLHLSNNYMFIAHINFIFVTILLYFLEIKAPPVYAMALLPMVLTVYSPANFGLNIALSSIVILGSNYIIINVKYFKSIK